VHRKRRNRSMAICSPRRHRCNWGGEPEFSPATDRCRQQPREYDECDRACKGDEISGAKTWVAEPCRRSRAYSQMIKLIANKGLPTTPAES